MYSTLQTKILAFSNMIQVELYTILITNVFNLLKWSQHARCLLCLSELGRNSCCDYDTINLPETFMIAHISDNKELSFSFFRKKENEPDFTCMLLSLKPSPVFYVFFFLITNCMQFWYPMWRQTFQMVGIHITYNYLIPTDRKSVV